MKRHILLFVFIVFFLSSCSSSKKKIEPKAEKKTPAVKIQPQPEETKPAPHRTHWSYSGLTGPEMWGDLNPEYNMCKMGTRQSPINLIWHKPTKKQKINLIYSESNYLIEDNGHTIKAIFSPGSKIQINGKNHGLVQLHFHSNSEHTIGGKHFPLEAHFVHKNSEGELSVLAVIFKTGQPNPYLESMWQQIPKERNRKIASATKFNPINLIPEIKTYYSYVGSLTTPPCSEGVNWFVFNTPIELSSEQLNHFKVLYANNNRPLQRANKRKVVNF